MRDDWQTVKLGEVFDIGSSKRVHKKDWAQEGVPFYRAREIVKLAKDGFVDNDLFITEELFEAFEGITGSPKAGDLMVTAVGTLGICYLVKPDDRFYFKDASVLWFQPKAAIETRYVEYLFQSPEIVEKSNDNKGATVGTLTISRARNIPIPLPPLPEQERIVAILDKAFEGIDQAIAHTEQNLASARELFESYLNNIFTQRGDGWVEKKLGDVCDTTQGVQIPKSKQLNEPREGYKRYLYITDFQSDDKLKFVEDIYPKKNVSGSDIIVANTGSYGKAFWGVDGILSNNLFKVTINHDLVTPSYLYYFVTSKSFINYQAGIAKGVANPHMGHKNFKSTPFPLPSLEEQLSILKTLDKLKEQTRQLEALYTQKLESLKELKQSLLQQAFAGELTKEVAA